MTGPKRYKLCTRCETSKPVEEFYQRKTGYLDRFCKPCSIADVARRKSEKRRIAREARLAEPAPTEFTCVKCAETKPIAAFYTNPAGRIRRDCRDCHRASISQWRSQNREHRSAADKIYVAKNIDAVRKRRMARYGITPEQYDSMYDAQNGCCLVCGTRHGRAGNGSVGGADVLCVDHHHGSGAVRGLLCSPCNRGIGLLGDDPRRLMAAVDYLKRDDSNGTGS